jgi:superfamily II DNA/RNA helicase
MFQIQIFVNGAYAKKTAQIKDINEQLADTLRIVEITKLPVQRAIIPQMLKKNIIIATHSGTGKTTSFLVGAFKLPHSGTRRGFGCTAGALTAIQPPTCETKSSSAFIMN